MPIEINNRMIVLPNVLTYIGMYWLFNCHAWLFMSPKGSLSLPLTSDSNGRKTTHDRFKHNRPRISKVVKRCVQTLIHERSFFRQCPKSPTFDFLRHRLSRGNQSWCSIQVPQDQARLKAGPPHDLKAACCNPNRPPKRKTTTMQKNRETNKPSLIIIN